MPNQQQRLAEALGLEPYSDLCRRTLRVMHADGRVDVDSLRPARYLRLAWLAFGVVRGERIAQGLDDPIWDLRVTSSILEVAEAQKEC